MRISDWSSDVCSSDLIVSSVLVMGIVPAAELEASSAPFALVAAEILGPWAAIAIAAAAALKATGNLGGWKLVTGETGGRAAQKGDGPGVCGRRKERKRGEEGKSGRARGERRGRG